jgi:DNA polymerase III subunit epsilon
MSKFVVFDVETANRERSSICSIGIVVVEDGRITDTFYSLVSPEPYYFFPYNVEIHGISYDDVEDSPTFEDLWPTIKPYFEDNFVIAHFSSFDMSCLRHALDAYDINYPSLQYGCTWQLSKNIIANQINYTLSTIAEYYNIKFEHHNALEDAKAAALIAINLLKEKEVDNFEELYKALGMTHGKLFEGGYKAPEKRYPDYTMSLKAETDQFDEEHPFYQKEVLFTGTLESMVRKDAQQKVLNVGGAIAKNVTKNTNYLVVGDLDFSKFKSGTKSNKLIKAEKYIGDGLDTQIINESDFLRMI